MLFTEEIEGKVDMVPIKKTQFHSEWSCYRETATALELDGWPTDPNDISEETRSQIEPYWADVESSLACELQFLDLRMASREKSHQYGASNSNLQTVPMRTCMTRFPEHDHVHLSAEDWAPHMPPGACKANLFDPSHVKLDQLDCDMTKLKSDPTVETTTAHFFSRDFEPIGCPTHYTSRLSLGLPCICSVLLVTQGCYLCCGSCLFLNSLLLFVVLFVSKHSFVVANVFFVSVC